MDISSTIADRSSRTDIKKAIMGGLLYLDDHQVPQQKDGDTFLPTVSDTSLELPGKSLPGEWSTDIHFKPAEPITDRSLVTIKDSNAFVPAATALPLFLFDEDKLKGTHMVEDMRAKAIDNVRTYRSAEGAYNFWPLLPGISSHESRRGPLNAPNDILQNPVGRFAFENSGIGSRSWLEETFDKHQNPSGTDELTNIPDDTDTIGLAVAVQELGRRAGQGKGDAAALDHIGDFRDVGRNVTKVPDEAWQGNNTGAFLTWDTKENLAHPFADPAHGVIPMAANDVGPVVNSNALLALSLTGKTSTPGYHQAVQLVTRTIEEHQWQNGTRYYPQPAVFPYAVTRAWHDGKIKDPGLTAAMGTLLKDLLAQQAPDGSFPAGKDDHSHDLSTAMSTVALLNIGKDVATKVGVADAYEKAVDKGVNYLVKDGHETALPGSDGKLQGIKWESGVFFSGSPFNAYWRSDSYTASVAVEALTKYVTATDLGGDRKLHPTQYAASADQAATDFQFKVS